MSLRKEKDEKDMEKIRKRLEKLPKFMSSYINSLSAADKSPRTINNYVKYNSDLIKYLNDSEIIDVNDLDEYSKIKPMHINDYFSSFEEAPASRSLRYSAIGNFFQFLEDNDFIPNNIMKKVHVKTPKKDDEITFLTKKEVKLVFKSFLLKHNVEHYDDMDFYGLRDYLIIALLLNTGMRASSLVQLELSDVDLKNHELTIVQKGNKKLKLAISDNMCGMISYYLKEREEFLKEKGHESSALIVSQRGAEMSRAMLWVIIKKWVNCIPGKNISPHKLRSTCATNLYDKTGDIYLTARRLGHASVSTTKRYTQISDEKLKLTSELFDDIF